MTRDRPALRLVESASTQEIEWSWFCGRCAAPAPSGAAPAPSSRVCPSCGFGILLESRADSIPSNKDAFLVIDSSLLVQGVSPAAESLLGVEEESAVNRPVQELLVPADAEAQGPSRFASAVAEVMGGEDSVGIFVRPWNTFGVRMRVKIAPCGPPRAALLVIESGAPSLRAV
jgi:PAS domain-containing protein